MYDIVDASGVFSVVCTGKDGKKKWEIEKPNLICTGGCNLLLDAGFSNADPGNESFCGLISDSGFGVISRTDTMTVKQWIESNCAGGTRPTIHWQSASTATKRFSTPAVFNVTTADTISGIFIVYGATSSSSVLDNSGVLWSATNFVNSSQAVVPGDSVSIQYLVSLFKLGVATPQVLVSDAVTAFTTQDAILNTTAVFDNITATQSSSVVMGWAKTGIDTLFAGDLSFASVLQIVPDDFAVFGLDILVSRDQSTAHVVQAITVTNGESLLGGSVSAAVVVASSPDTLNTVRIDLLISEGQSFVRLVKTVIGNTSDSISANEVAFALVGSDDFSTFMFDILNARDQGNVHIVKNVLGPASDSLSANQISQATVIASAPHTFEPVRFDILLATDTANVHLVDSITTTASESLAAGFVSFVTVIPNVPHVWDVVRLDLSLAQDSPFVHVTRTLARSDSLTATSASVASLTTANQQLTDLLIANITQSTLITRVASRSDSLIASFIEHSSAVLADFGSASDSLNATDAQTVLFIRRGTVLEVQGHDLTDTSTVVFKRAAPLIEAAAANDIINGIVSSPGNWFDAVAETVSAADNIGVGVTKVATIIEPGSAGSFQFIDPWFLVDSAGNFVIDSSGNLVIAPGTGP